MDFRGYPGGEEGREMALDILKQRYAKGGITSDEFERIKKEVHHKNEYLDVE